MLRAMLAILLGLMLHSAASAGSPEFFALQRTGASAQCASAPVARIVKAQPYPYGYFGATSARGIWSHSANYYGSAHQWTRR